MKQFATNEEYFQFFEEAIKTSDREIEDLLLYFNVQRKRMKNLIKILKPKTFWQVFPEILGIDAKLMLLIELIGFDDFPTQEIIRIAEEDYLFYFKELCGYDLSKETRPSIIFNVA